MDYKCSKCGLHVIVTPSEIIKPCNCNEAIVAEISATVHGLTAMNEN